MVANCTADDSSPLTDSDSCAVPVVAVFTASSTPALDGDGTSAAIALPDGFEPVSGALTLQVDGRAAGLLPCAAAGCTAKLTFPVPAAESAKAGRAFMCVRVNAAGKMQPDTAAVVAGEAAQRAGDASAPRFSCDVKQAGTYLLGSYTRPAAPAPAQAVPEVVAYDNVTGYVSCFFVPCLRVFVCVCVWGGGGEEGGVVAGGGGLRRSWAAARLAAQVLLCSTPDVRRLPFVPPHTHTHTHTHTPTPHQRHTNATPGRGHARVGQLQV
jgi:hypothetical protein